MQDKNKETIIEENICRLLLFIIAHPSAKRTDIQHFSKLQYARLTEYLNDMRNARLIYTPYNIKRQSQPINYCILRDGILFLTDRGYFQNGNKTETL